MASPTDILASLQQGVVAINNFNTQMKGSLTNIATQISSINSQITGLSSQITGNSSQITLINSEITNLQAADYVQNILINGAMDVSQFNGTNAVAGTGSAYVVDQWQIGGLSATIAVSTQQVSISSAPAGLTLQNCLQLTATTGSGTVAANDFMTLFQQIEGYRFAHLGFGTSIAQSISVGFWVKATIAGTMTVSLHNTSNARSYVSNVAINSPNTWEWKNLTIPGDTTGTWPSTNGPTGYIAFVCVAGASQQGTNNTWNAANVLGTSSTTNFLASTSNSFSISGVTILPGSITITSAQSAALMRPVDVELALCQRYYEKSYDLTSLPGAIVTQGESTVFLGGLPAGTYLSGPYQVFSVPKRSAPTITTFSRVTGASGVAFDASAGVDVSTGINTVGTKGFSWEATMAGAATTINLQAHWVANARM